MNLGITIYISLIDMLKFLTIPLAKAKACLIRVEIMFTHVEKWNGEKHFHIKILFVNYEEVQKYKWFFEFAPCS